jgi:hypothetical protein
MTRPEPGGCAKRQPAARPKVQPAVQPTVSYRAANGFSLLSSEIHAPSTPKSSASASLCYSVSKMHPENSFKLAAF